MKASIIGLGLIGSEWAKHLEKDGILGASWNRSPKPEMPLYINKLCDIPKLAQIIHIVVADPPAVSEILNQILPGLNESHLLIQSSTIDPGSSKGFVELVKKTGAKYLEAPFTGSLPAAEKRELVFYLGGNHETVEIARPYLQRLSKKLFHIGDEKQACFLKLVMNLQISACFEALAEALSTSRSAGIRDETFFEAFKLNASYSGVAALKEAKLISNDFSPQFSIKHMGKDMRLLKKSLTGTNLPILEKIVELFDLAESQGLSDEDFSSLIKLR